LRILHTSGIVIGAGVIVGKNCTILHGVTLGVKNILRPAQERDFPQIGSDVTLAAYVSIFGRVIIQDASFIPAHATIVEGAREKQKVVRKSKTGGHW